MKKVSGFPRLYRPFNLRRGKKLSIEGYFSATRVLALIAGIASLVLIIFISTDVFGRYLFNKPLPASCDIPICLTGVLVFFALAHDEVHKIHVRLTSIQDRVNPLYGHIIDILTYLLGFVLLGVVTWQAWPWAWESWVSGIYMKEVVVPYFPIRFIYAIGMTSFAIVLGIRLFQSIGQFRSREKQ